MFVVVNEEVRAERAGEARPGVMFPGERVEAGRSGALPLGS